MIQVALKSSTHIEEVDAEIVVVAGCALGFVAEGQPPHVLHVDPGTEMERHGVQSDDLLVAIDGKDPKGLNQQEIAKALKGAASLTFQHPTAQPDDDADTDPPSGDEGQARPPAVAGAVLATAGDGSVGIAQASEEAPSTEQATARGRSRSRRRRRHSDRESRRALGAPPEGTSVGSAPPTTWEGSGPSAPSPAPGGQAPPPPGHPPSGWPSQQDRPPPPTPWGLGGPAAPPPPWASGPPPPGYAGGSPPGDHRPPPPWDPWRPPPPNQWGVPPPYAGHPKGSGKGPRDRGPPRLERDENGGATVVVERVPQTVNNIDVLNEFFGKYGAITDLQINRARHEAIITFAKAEEAEEALRYPVLNDPNIGLRPWRSKGAGRYPGPLETFRNEAVPVASAPPQSPDAPAAVEGAQQPPGNAPPSHTEGIAIAAQSQLAVPGQPAPDAASGNRTMEAGDVLVKKRKREELEDKRTALLQGLTDQLKKIMERISDPKTNDKNREQLQAVLAKVKEKMTDLTPKVPEPEPPPMPPPPKHAPAAPHRPPARRQVPVHPGHLTLVNSEWEARQSASLRLINLPEEFKGDEAHIRKQLEGIESVSFTEEGASCIVRFTERRLAEAVLHAQRVWGFTAAWQEDESAKAASHSLRPTKRRPPPPTTPTRQPPPIHARSPHTPGMSRTDEVRKAAAEAAAAAAAAAAATAEMRLARATAAAKEVAMMKEAMKDVEVESNVTDDLESDLPFEEFLALQQDNNELKALAAEAAAAEAALAAEAAAMAATAAARARQGLPVAPVQPPKVSTATILITAAISAPYDPSAKKDTPPQEPTAEPAPDAPTDTVEKETESTAPTVEASPPVLAEPMAVEAAEANTEASPMTIPSVAKDVSTPAPVSTILSEDSGKEKMPEEPTPPEEPTREATTPPAAATEAATVATTSEPERADLPESTVEAPKATDPVVPSSSPEVDTAAKTVPAEPEAVRTDAPGTTETTTESSGAKDVAKETPGETPTDAPPATEAQEKKVETEDAVEAEQGEAEGEEQAEEGAEEDAAEDEPMQDIAEDDSSLAEKKAADAKAPAKAAAKSKGHGATTPAQAKGRGTAAAKGRGAAPKAAKGRGAPKAAPPPKGRGAPRGRGRG